MLRRRTNSAGWLSLNIKSAIILKVLFHIKNDEREHAKKKVI